MPQTKRPKMKGRYVEIPKEMDAALVRYCRRVGSKYAVEVRRAIGRHLEYPPDTTPEALPDSAAAKGRGK